MTVRDNEICRLFVLLECQGRGYGTEMLDYAEKLISDHYPEVTLLPHGLQKVFMKKEDIKKTAFI